VRSACIAALLAVSVTLAHAQGHIDTRPRPAEPALDSSFLDPKPGWGLRSPSTGAGEPKQGVRTIRILPDDPPAPEPPRRYYAQLTTQRTSQEAQDRFDEIQQRFPGALGSRQSVIMRTDAGLSTVYRAMVGPFDLAGATAMCDGLRAQGGPCVVHRIDPEE
jgi:hypothetical protein